MILVTGGAGYIGSHVNKELNRKGYDTLVIDNMYSGHRELVKRGILIEGDIGNKTLLKEIFSNYPIEAVCHLAAYTEVDESVIHPRKYYENNVQNTISLLNMMLEFKINKFIFSSTSAVYSETSAALITEASKIDPLSPYGRSKLFVDEILKDYNHAYGLGYVSFRYFNAAGCDLDGELGEWHEPETHLIPVVFEAISGKRDHFKIFGTDYETYDGTCIRDYIHVLDIAAAHSLALEQLKTNPISGVFNLGYGKGFSVREIVERVRKVTRRNINTVDWQRRVGDAPSSVASSDKARTVLGWSPKYDDLDLIIESAWNWYQKQPGTV
jgi:UDP-glucose 4-epimerase